MTPNLINRLTDDLGRRCQGQSVATVIAAAFNLMEGAFASVPDPGILKAAAHTFRQFADKLDERARQSGH